VALSGFVFILAFSGWEKHCIAFGAWVIGKGSVWGFDRCFCPYGRCVGKIAVY
jgi:hypothetical protein